METSVLSTLENIEEFASEDTLKQVDDAVKRVIENYRNYQGQEKNLQDDKDVLYLASHPRESLMSFYKILKIAEKADSEHDDESQPDLVPKQPFNNVNLFHRMPAGFVRKTPKNKDDLINIIQEAADQKKNIKAVGSCYAFSNISFTDGVIIEMNKYLHNILEIDQTVLRKSTNVDELCQMEAGTLIESILEHLWPEKERDKVQGYRTMMNQTGYNGLSIAGTTGTGAHGSGIDKPPIPDCIESMHLITLDENFKVKQYRIEPSNGITSPKKFKAKYPDVKLIQDDIQFYATTVHVGALGVVYSYIIKVQPAFYLEEDRKIFNWDNVKAMIPDLVKRNLKKPTDPDYIHSFEVWISPYPPLYGNMIWAVISTYKLAPPKRKNKRPFSFSTSNIENELIRKLTVWCSRNLQELLPLVMFIALWTTVEREPVTMPSTEALSFGSPNGVKVLTSENGIDASNPETPIKAVDAMIAEYQNSLQEDNRFFTTAPFSMRFTAPSKSFLAMQYKRPSCMVETPILLGTFGQHSTLSRTRNLVQSDYKSRPHWGQINNMTGKKLKELYPDSYKKFLTVYKKFNVSQLFSNYFTKDFDE
ncbi:L-gulono-1,4-lactone dehydrogenase-like [Clytia hemisphaerica]|uniref:FAD-binding PCMH-type domain-containing protein n=1 Tax=Clytia hemisphaerica TaxID=252671 RepID=A0A7M5WQ45_9CNID